MNKNKGKEYEKKVINDFNIFVKYLFNKDITISSNPLNFYIYNMNN